MNDRDSRYAWFGQTHFIVPEAAQFTVNQSRDEPRLVPTMSLPAGAQVGCEYVACGACMESYL
jgi:hypothetical protein